MISFSSSPHQVPCGSYHRFGHGWCSRFVFSHSTVRRAQVTGGGGGRWGGWFLGFKIDIYPSIPSWPWNKWQLFYRKKTIIFWSHQQFQGGLLFQWSLDVHSKFHNGAYIYNYVVLLTFFLKYNVHPTMGWCSTKQISIAQSVSKLFDLKRPLHQQKLTLKSYHPKRKGLPC